MQYVYSTLASGTDYAEYHTEGNLNTPKRIVSIKGGANVAQKIKALAGESLTSPGEVTEVSDEDAAFLAQHPVFKQQQQAGFVRIVQRLGKVEKVVQDMNQKDPSRPLTIEDAEKGGRIDGANISASTLS